MAACYLLNKASKRMEHVRKGLPWTWLRKEYHEVHRMTFVKRNADFRVALEAADPRSMSGARVNYNNRRLVDVDAVIPTVIADLRNTKQRIIHGTFKTPCIQQSFGSEIEQRRKPRTLMLQHIVCPLAERVPEKNRALRDIALIGEQIGRLPRRRPELPELCRRAWLAAIATL